MVNSAHAHAQKHGKKQYLRLTRALNLRHKNDKFVQVSHSHQEIESKLINQM